MTRSLETWIAFVCELSACVAGGYIAGWMRGFSRGRELERMQLPERGELHFRDGHIVEVVADSPLDAIERVARINGKVGL